jgi:hypothetical protein
VKSPGLVAAPSGNPETDGPIEDFNKNLVELSELVNSNSKLFAPDAAAAAR